MTRMPVGRKGARTLRSEESPSRGCSGGCSTFADLRDAFAFPGAFIGSSSRELCVNCRHHSSAETAPVRTPRLFLITSHQARSVLAPAKPHRKSNFLYNLPV